MICGYLISIRGCVQGLPDDDGCLPLAHWLDADEDHHDGGNHKGVKKQHDRLICVELSSDHRRKGLIRINKAPTRGECLSAGSSV
jgi:hypothetical protein